MNNDTKNGNVSLSHDYMVLQPKRTFAYTITCGEWAILKTKVNSIADIKWILQNLGSLLLGIAIPVLITILLDAFPDSSKERARTIAWVTFAITFAAGLGSWGLAFGQKKTKTAQKTEIIDFMALIESRYEETADES